MKNFNKLPLKIIIAVTAVVILSACVGVNSNSNVTDDSTTDENAPKTETTTVPFPWGGNYYAVGKKSGTIFICSFDDNGKPIWNVMDSESNS